VVFAAADTLDVLETIAKRPRLTERKAATFEAELTEQDLDRPEVTEAAAPTFETLAASALRPLLTENSAATVDAPEAIAKRPRSSRPDRTPTNDTPETVADLWICVVTKAAAEIVEADVTAADRPRLTDAAAAKTDTPETRAERPRSTEANAAAVDDPATRADLWNSVVTEAKADTVDDSATSADLAKSVPAVGV